MICLYAFDIYLFIYFAPVAGGPPPEDAKNGSHRFNPLRDSNAQYKAAIGDSHFGPWVTRLTVPQQLLWVFCILHSLMWLCVEHFFPILLPCLLSHLSFLLCLYPFLTVWVAV